MGRDRGNGKRMGHEEGRRSVFSINENENEDKTITKLK